MLGTKLQNLNQIVYPQKLFYSPKWLVLGVNNICNLHCKMCDVGTGYSESNFYYHLMGAKPTNMPLELFQLICDQAAQFYPNVKLGYAFTEPLIYPHLLPSLEYAKTKKLYTAITTNGLKLKKLAQNLADVSLGEIAVSLDGPPKTHNEIRGNSQSFEWAFEGMEMLHKYSNGKTKMSVFCTITEWNYDKLKEFARYFEKMPLQTLGFMHTNYTNTGMAAAHNARWGEIYPATESNLAQINLENINLPRLSEEIQQLRKLNLPFPITFSPNLTDLQGIENFYLHPENKIGKRCNDAFLNLMIKSNGTVIPAHGRCYDVIAGNLYENDLQQIWNSPSLAQFRKDLMKDGGLMPACSRCCSAF